MKSTNVHQLQTILYLLGQAIDIAYMDDETMTRYLIEAKRQKAIQSSVITSEERLTAVKPTEFWSIDTMKKASVAERCLALFASSMRSVNLELHIKLIGLIEKAFSQKRDDDVLERRTENEEIASLIKENGELVRQLTMFEYKEKYLIKRLNRFRRKVINQKRVIMEKEKETAELDEVVTRLMEKEKEIAELDEVVTRLHEELTFEREKAGAVVGVGVSAGLPLRVDLVESLSKVLENFPMLRNQWHEQIAQAIYDTMADRIKPIQYREIGEIGEVEAFDRLCDQAAEEILLTLFEPSGGEGDDPQDPNKYVRDEISGIVPTMPNESN